MEAARELAAFLDMAREGSLTKDPAARTMSMMLKTAKLCCAAARIREKSSRRAKEKFWKYELMVSGAHREETTTDEYSLCGEKEMTVSLGLPVCENQK